MKKNLEKIVIPVSFEKPPKEEIPLMAFLFGRKGKLLQQAPVAGNSVELSNPGLDLRELRLFIAPASDKSIQQVSSIAGLQPFKPYEPVLALKEGKISTLAIPSIIARFWPHCHCRVTGNVSKWFYINDIWQDRPICQARVHIMDIDAIWYWIYKIPDYIIQQVAKAIIDPSTVVPFHPPVPDPGPIESLSVRSLKINATPNIFKTTSADDTRLNTIQQLPGLSDDILQKFSSGNVELIRETIAKNYALLHARFCYWPYWWHYFYVQSELTVVYTDTNGNFDTDVRYFCDGDRPDIYIWVECMINGIWTTVYKPYVPCNTHWNYVCGTPINIQVTDPRVLWGCNEVIPGQVVWVKTIGQSASVSHILQTHLLQAPPSQTKKYDRIGLTDSAALGDPWYLPTSVGDFLRPFGGELTFVLQFGDGMPNAGMYYYRWSYTQVAHADLSAASDTWHQLNTAMTKGYTFEYTDGTGTHFGPGSVALGPTTVGANNNLFIIPPVNPADAPFSVPQSSPFWDQNTDSITFDTSGLADGLYEFKLELFDKGGNLLTAILKNIFQVPDYNVFSPSVNAPDALLENPTVTTADAYNMQVRLDNSKCAAGINTVKIDGVASSPDCCGFVSYKPGGVESENIELSFQASQPNNFAVFGFSVAKGTCGDVSDADANGMVIDSADGYALSGGTYDKSFTPSDLLGSCYDSGAGKAAFAEVLGVAAMATNGTSRIAANDPPPGSITVAAFALEP